MPDDHETIVSRATRGDPASVDTLLVRHLPALRAFVRLGTGEAIRNRESCSDLVQSVCREVLLDMDRLDYRGEAAFKHWLFTRASHKIRDRVKYHRAQKRDAGREVAAPDGDDHSYGGVYAHVFTPSRVVGGREALAQAEALFDRLSEDHREVILLARVVGLSHAEIAQQLGRTEAAVRQLFYRACIRLSALMRARGH